MLGKLLLLLLIITSSIVTMERELTSQDLYNELKRKRTFLRGSSIVHERIKVSFDSFLKFAEAAHLTNAQQILKSIIKSDFLTIYDQEINHKDKVETTRKTIPLFSNTIKSFIKDEKDFDRRKPTASLVLFEELSKDPEILDTYRTWKNNRTGLTTEEFSRRFLNKCYQLISRLGIKHPQISPDGKINVFEFLILNETRSDDIPLKGLFRSSHILALAVDSLLYEHNSEFEKSLEAETAAIKQSIEQIRKLEQK